MGRPDRRHRHRGPLGPSPPAAARRHAQTRDRVAGLLVLLYAQWPATISRLTLGHVQRQRRPSTAPPRPRARRPPRAARPPSSASSSPPAADTPPSATREPRPGCSPAGSPAARSAPTSSAERLRQLGLHPGQARSTALFQLATDLPAALLARMLGIHITRRRRLATRLRRRLDQPTPPTSAAEPSHNARHSDSSNIRRRQAQPAHSRRDRTGCPLPDPWPTARQARLNPG